MTSASSAGKAIYEHDKEQWDVAGAPSGEALTRAAASVVDELADRMRRATAALDRGEKLP